MQRVFVDLIIMKGEEEYYMNGKVINLIFKKFFLKSCYFKSHLCCSLFIWSASSNCSIIILRSVQSIQLKFSQFCLSFQRANILFQLIFYCLFCFLFVYLFFYCIFCLSFLVLVWGSVYSFISSFFSCNVRLSIKCLSSFLKQMMLEIVPWALLSLYPICFSMSCFCFFFVFEYLLISLVISFLTSCLSVFSLISTFLWIFQFPSVIDFQLDPFRGREDNSYNIYLWKSIKPCFFA